MSSKATLEVCLGSIQIFNGLSGLLGGYMLITDPTGDSLYMNLNWLKGTPFPNFLIPGILLFLFIGVSNIYGSWFTFKKSVKLAHLGLFSGIILMIWILSQLAMIGYKGFLQPLYFVSGLLQTIAGVILLKWNRL
ncbi:hypothetical protein [Salegentibacter chungangensis]|uniref:Uncharacterized protein n=1 Tax=Salegentibacter chungangensis TaxID=1335724 RepID=A0ABW3NUP3_9FLAO